MATTYVYTRGREGRARGLFWGRANSTLTCSGGSNSVNFELSSSASLFDRLPAAHMLAIYVYENVRRRKWYDGRECE